MARSGLQFDVCFPDPDAHDTKLDTDGEVMYRLKLQSGDPRDIESDGGAHVDADVEMHMLT